MDCTHDLQIFKSEIFNELEAIWVVMFVSEISYLS